MSTKMLSLIVAYHKETRGINLLWDRLPEDMKFFQSVTKGKVVIMGRKTWESLPVKPLPDRINVVISSTMVTYQGDVRVYRSLKRAIEAFRERKTVIIGGQDIYTEALIKYVINKLYITTVESNPRAIDPSKFDRFFPQFDIEKYYSLCGRPEKYVTDQGTEYTISVYEVIYHMLRINDIQRQYLKIIGTVLSQPDRICRNGVTKSSFIEKMEFNLEDGHIPLDTLRRTSFKGIVEETLWILRGQTDSKLLESRGVKIWEANTNREFLDKCGLSLPEGCMGPTYGWNYRSFGADYNPDLRSKSGSHGGVDQFSDLIRSLKSDPTGRRHIILNWNPVQNKQSPLPPCMMFLQFYVRDGHLLDCFAMNRSNDLIVAGMWNSCTAALIVRILCKFTGLDPGVLYVQFNDCHIYKEHIGRELNMLRSRLPDRIFPKLNIKYCDNGTDDKSVDSILNDMSYDDFELIDYNPYPAIKFKMIA